MVGSKAVTAKRPASRPLTSTALLGAFLAAACAPTLTPPPTTHATQATPSSTTYATAPCPTSLPVVAGMACGHLTVPLDRARPAGPEIQLGVVRFAPTGAGTKADPILWVDFGLGGASAAFAVGEIDQTLLRPGHEVIVVDQRASGISEPSVGCPEVERANRDELLMTTADAERANVDAYRACANRLRASGIDLSTLSSATNTADLIDLRHALGITKWNLYGVSSQTWMALRLASEDPEAVRSMLLDSVKPPQVDDLAEWGPNAARAIDALFAACAADAACASAYPNLSATFDRVVAALDAAPRRVSFADPVSGGQLEGLATGDIFIMAVFDTLYDTTAIPRLPRLIENAARGDDELLVNAFGASIQTGTDWAAYMQVFCSESFLFTTHERIDAAAAGSSRPRVARSFASWADSGLDACRAMGISPAPQLVRNAVALAIPTVILSGGLDPITPPSWASLAASTLSASRIYSVPLGGHGILTSSRCARKIATAFLADPAAFPPDECATTGSTPAFVP